MKKKIYDSKLNNSQRLVKVTLFFIGALIVSNGALVGIVYLTSTTQRTVLLTPDLKGPVSFDGGGNYNDRYLTQMATWFAQLTLTYHPTSYDYQVNQLLEYADPAVHGSLKAQLLADRGTVNRRQYSSVFYPDGVEVRGGSVGIKGRLTTFVGGRQIDERAAGWRVSFTQLSTGRIAVRELKETDYDNPLGVETAASR